MISYIFTSLLLAGAALAQQVEVGRAPVLLPAAAGAVAGALAAPILPPSAISPAGRLTLSASPIAVTPVSLVPALAQARTLSPGRALAIRAAVMNVSAQAMAERLLAPARARGTGAAEEPAAVQGPAALTQGPAAQAGKVASRARRPAAPILSNVSYDAAIAAEQRQLLDDSLRRRKAGWTKGLASAGIKLDAPEAPTFVVRSARVSSLKGTSPYVAYQLDWKQGPFEAGSLSAYITIKNLQTSVRRGPSAPIPDERQVSIRFKTAATPAEIEAFFASRGMKSLGRRWDGIYTADTRRLDASAAAVARELMAGDLVLYAGDAKPAAASGIKTVLVFRRDGKTESEDAVARVVRAENLRVVEAKEGRYTVMAPDAAALARLNGRDEVLYAAADAASAPESRQVIVNFKGTRWTNDAPSEVTDAAVASLLRRHGLEVLVDYGRAYKIAIPEGVSQAELAAKLKAETGVAEAVTVGSLTDDHVQGSARGTIGHKGMPWSETEYNLVYYQNQLYLEMAGATEAQLKKYQELCDKAPVNGRFNPWSGD